MTTAFPFSALVGQEAVKLSLMISAVDPGVGGVLILGDRGTGKSTAIRALASLLPPMQSIDGCAYHRAPDEFPDCDCEACSRGTADVASRAVPVVDMPLGVTEDRVVGAFDIEHALNTGEKRFQPGLLADAHRGFLYVDEVNLLEDHIVDVLLDVAASGVNVVERDGISARHPARFVLIGSGNPEEGELRPQLLDRFGLSVEVHTPTDVEERMQVVMRRGEFDLDPQRFVEQWQQQEAKVRRRIVSARKGLAQVDISDDMRETVSRLCIELNTDGLRGDLTLLRAARAAAALQGAPAVAQTHIVQVASMALCHRLRRDPLDDVGSVVRIERVLSAVFDADAA
jgi:magnesium chelatase subunit I